MHYCKGITKYSDYVVQLLQRGFRTTDSRDKKNKTNDATPDADDDKKQNNAHYSNTLR
jgi:hypothetical protein